MINLGVHDKDYIVFDELLSEAPLILDVGANVGQSIRSFKVVRPRAKIESFEPNPALHSRLIATKELFTDGLVKLHFCGLSDTDAELTFYTPVVDGVPRFEESSIYLSEFDKPWIKERLSKAGKSLHFEKFEAQVKSGDSFNFAPDLIKIDVEGAELSVVRGLRQTIVEHAPFVMTENSDFNNVTNYFVNDLNYTVCMPDNTGRRLIRFEGERANAIYVPAKLKDKIGLD